ncbi:MAG: adenylyl-sulfate kinase [Candidatus Velthaea sp.]
MNVAEPDIAVLEDAVTRVVVAGHVDHGKSTLIGRLLYDLGVLHQSRIDDVVASSARRGTAPEWSYLLDSLQEERDQAITIDTTRLWFTHAARRYTIIDAPGHRQFLANMLSGASEADGALLVVDASEGIGEQTLRHAYLLGFLGIRHVVVALNKIDLLADPQARVAELRGAIEAALHRTPPVAIVPISASLGYNVVARAATPWYDGPTVMEAISAMRRRETDSARPLRLHVQDVYRRAGERIAVGTLASGVLRSGDDVVVVPTGERARVARVQRWPEGTVESPAQPGESIGVILAGDPFIGRGTSLVATGSAEPTVAREPALEVFWLDAVPPRAGETIRLKHGTQDVCAVIADTPRVYDIDAAADGTPDRAQHNIVNLTLRAGRAVAFDTRDADPAGARCVVLRAERVAGIGFTVRAAATATPAGASDPVTLAERERRAGHRAGIVWLTGLSGAGKTTIARAVERALFERGAAVSVLDGDELRGRLNEDLGFSEADRAQSVRRAAAVADLLAKAGGVVLVALIAPFAADRSAARRLSSAPFHEIFVNATLAACERRDPKGLYARRRRGELTGFTGIDAPYEPPEAADLELRTDGEEAHESAARLLRYIEDRVL